MRLRLIEDKKERKILCPNGTVMKADNEVLRRLLTGFTKPNTFKGKDVYWNALIPSMEDVAGITLAYVDDSYKLVIINPTTFQDVIVNTRYISPAEYADKHGKGVAIVKRMCGEGRLEGAYRTSSGWMIPENAPYPERKPRTVVKKV